MRGDPPEVSPDKVDKLVSTPHARGSTQIPYQFAFSVEVYPACAGIHPSICADLHATVRLPRMRGDPPTLISAARFRRQSTPHARGSTSFGGKAIVEEYVYPACAGIHPIIIACYLLIDRLPRMRGDPPFFRIFTNR
jgi:hypothetical protein